MWASAAAAVDESVFQSWVNNLENEIGKVLTKYNIDQAADELKEIFEMNLRLAEINPKKLTKKNADKLSKAFEQTLHMVSVGYDPVEMKNKHLDYTKS